MHVGNCNVLACPLSASVAARLWQRLRLHAHHDAGSSRPLATGHAAGLDGMAGSCHAKPGHMKNTLCAVCSVYFRCMVGQECTTVSLYISLCIEIILLILYSMLYREYIIVSAYAVLAGSCRTERKGVMCVRCRQHVYSARYTIERSSQHCIDGLRRRTIYDERWKLTKLCMWGYLSLSHAKGQRSYGIADAVHGVYIGIVEMLCMVYIIGIVVAGVQDVELYMSRKCLAC